MRISDWSSDVCSSDLIAELMRLRDAGADETPEGDAIEEAIRRQVVLLWQTRPLRTEKLFVADEIDNALTYLQGVFLPVVPKLYARWEAELGRRPASFLRVGSWIGGDRSEEHTSELQSLMR